MNQKPRPTNFPVGSVSVLPGRSQTTAVEYEYGEPGVKQGQ